MFALVQSLVSRLKTLFALDAALDLEQQFLARQVERKAELHRQAQRLEREGLDGLAAELRQQADALSTERPLQVVLPYFGGEPSLTPAREVPLLSTSGRVASATA